MSFSRWFLTAAAVAVVIWWLRGGQTLGSQLTVDPYSGRTITIPPALRERAGSGGFL